MEKENETEDTIRELVKSIGVIENRLNEFSKAIKDIQCKLGNKTLPKSNNERKIDDLMENFDFEKVKKVMDFLDWTWYGESKPPSIEALKRNARDMLERAVEEKTCISSAGFKAVYENDPENPNDPYIGLEFILEDMEGFVEP